MNVDVEEFLGDLELSGLNPKTVNTYRYALNPFFRKTKKQSGKQVTLQDVRRYLAEYKQTHKHNSYWQTSERLKRFFKRYNPKIAAYIQSLKIREERRKIETFTPKERKRFLQAILDYGKTASPIIKLRDAAVFELLNETGMRIFEACWLNIENVDFTYPADSSVVHFRLEKTKGKRGGLGEPRDNYVPKNRKAIQLLEQYLKLRDDLSHQAPLFVSQKGTRLHPERIEDKFRKIKKKLGIKKKWTPHTSKHTCCTEWLVKKGKNAKTVGNYVGTSPEVLLKTYIHPKEEDMRKLAKS